MTESKTKPSVILKDISKFYGDVLGVNRISLQFEPGIIGLVGPNGAGKSTLMNIMTGLVHPNRGSVSVLGAKPTRTESFYRLIGYCTQYDSFPPGVTGRQFIENTLRLHGYTWDQVDELTDLALTRVDLMQAAERPVAGYSKGMRQRIKLAQAFSHNPKVLVLDEPLNGLDPMARAQVNSLFREFAEDGVTVIVSSHVLREVDLMADQIVLIDNGYLVAEGDVAGIRSETGEPMRIFIRSQDATAIASNLFDFDHVIEAQLHNDHQGLFVRTVNADAFFSEFNSRVLSQAWRIEGIGPADETVEAVYRHLIVKESLITDKVAS